MKYLLMLMLLTSCVSQQKTYQFTCTVFNAHGVFAKVTGDFYDADRARLATLGEMERPEVRKFIPDSFDAVCFRSDE